MRKTFSKLFISLVIPIAIFFVLAQPTSAQSEPYYLHLDQNTVEKGYTVPSRGQDFLVGIRPDVFAEPLTVKIVQENAEGYNLPAGKKLVSPIYTYDLRMDNPQVLARPIIVGLKMSGYFPEASLYFFNRVSNSFQPIPTNFDQANQWARAFIHFPYTTIAVLADSLEAQFLQLDSAVALAAEADSGEIIFQKNQQEKRSIASLTKLMTALVVLDQEIDWQKTYVIPNDYCYQNSIGSKLYLREGEVVTVRDLFFSMLTGSANNAALALVDAVGFRQTDFVKLMNQKAEKLGMTNTHFSEPSGLSPENQSTALDLLKLSQEAFRHFIVLQATTIRSYSFATVDTGTRHQIKATNQLVNSDLYLTGSKTGYLDEAGYCLIIKARNKQNREIISLVLGNSSWQDRFAEVAQLAYYAFNNL